MYGLEEEEHQTEGRRATATAPRWLLILAGILALAPACAPLAQNIVAQGKAARMLPRFAVCPDGEAIRLLIDRRCPGGVCGYSCLPGRWDALERSDR